MAENKKKKFFHKGNLIKWYEYKMQYDTDEEDLKEKGEDKVEDITDNASGGGEIPDYRRELSEEEFAQKMGELNDDDQALVADILSRFSDAKQTLVDDLLENGTGNDSAGEPSEEDIISRICAPKQSNVDSLVNMARDGM